VHDRERERERREKKECNVAKMLKPPEYDILKKIR
jgi:hypothetical protein